jgi:predicted nucleic acid-binding protein
VEDLTLLVDSSVLLDLEKRHKETIQKMAKLSEQHPQAPRVSFMTYFEFLYGIENRPIEEKAVAQEFIRNFSVVHTTNETALLLASLKQKYGNQKSLTDLFISSQAIENNLMLVTRDKDFADLKEIKKIIL